MVLIFCDIDMNGGLGAAVLLSVKCPLNRQKYEAIQKKTGATIKKASKNTDIPNIGAKSVRCLAQRPPRKLGRGMSKVCSRACLLQTFYAGRDGAPQSFFRSDSKLFM
jgi:hypothetical protein